MAKARSPGYPAIGLREALEKAQAIYERDYTNPIPRSVAVDHMGYASLNGTSLGVLSALGKYGLLEGRADETHISPLAVQIIAHSPGEPERVAALKEAAGMPELFKELDLRFQGGKASDQALRSFLLTQKFIPPAADAAIRSYRETKQLMESESAGYIPSASDREETAIVEVFPGVSARPPVAAPPAIITEGEPYRIAFGARSGLEVVGKLQNEEDADALIQALNTWKALLRKVPKSSADDGSKST
jgi:hypothetical protein